jgi:FAD-dependent urate hydroxylase
LSTDGVLIIGAGPFGLSVAAHLRQLGVEHRIVGRPMDTWKAHMPPGMYLRSEPYGSDMAAPDPGWDVEAYCRKHGLDYVERLGPLSGERFLDYADWYTAHLVPEVSDLSVVAITPVDGGFQVSFAEADSIVVRSVVVATGILPYARMPVELAGLPSDVVSHTADHHDLTRFREQRVVVLGGGQSALETAALLHETGVDTRVVMRRDAINWLRPNPVRISGIGRIRRPVNKLCEGWHCALWNSPPAFRRLPERVRVDKAASVLGPAGAWWLEDRISGVVPVLTNHRLKSVTTEGSAVRIFLDGPECEIIDADHLIAGTGFRVDIGRLAFLPPQLQAGIKRINGYPVVNRAGESTVPGLYFAGAPAAASLGPSVRFIAGTHTSVPQLARSIARGARSTRRPGRSQALPRAT